MTTRVTITVDPNSHCSVKVKNQVEPINDQTLELPVYPTVLLPGQVCDFWVHSGQSLIVSEVK